MCRFEFGFEYHSESCTVELYHSLQQQLHRGGPVNCHIPKDARFIGSAKSHSDQFCSQRLYVVDLRRVLERNDRVDDLVPCHNLSKITISIQLLCVALCVALYALRLGKEV